MADNTPIILGQYRVSKTLGIGAFGKVKREMLIVTQFSFIAISFTCTQVVSYSCDNFMFHVLLIILLHYCYVLVAYHVITNQKVAIKILNRGKIKHMEMLEKVRREINILKMCTHPHIIRL